MGVMGIIRKYRKEILIVAALAILLNILMEFVPFATPATKADLYSPMLMVIAVIALMLPGIAAIPGGYLIAKKTKEQNPAIIGPALGAALAGVLIIVWGIGGIMLASDAEIQAEMDKTKIIGVDFFDEMSVSEFRSFTLTSSIIGLVFLIIINSALGAAGGYIGRAIAMRK